MRDLVDALRHLAEPSDDAAAASLSSTPPCTLLFAQRREDYEVHLARHKSLDGGLSFEDFYLLFMDSIVGEGRR